MAPAPIRYTYCWDDYVALSKVIRRENPWKRHQIIIVPVAMSLALLVGLAAVTAWNGGNAARAVRFALATWQFWLLAPGIMILIPIINRIELAVWYKRQHIDGVEIGVMFDDPQGLRSESKDGAGVIAWSAIRKVATEGDRHVVLQQNRIVGVCLPRRAFASDAHFAAARAHIEDQMARPRSAAA